jgi:integral membrane protein
MTSIRTQFRVAALLEALSWAGLLIGMYCKYGAMNNPIGVKIMGPVHGVLFVIYCIAAVRLAREARWSLAVTALALLASVPPFTTWLFERWIIKRG